MRWLLRALAVALVVTAGGLLGSLFANNPPFLDPPGVLPRLRTYLGSNVAETADDSPFPELRPRHYPGVPPDVLFRLVAQAVSALPRSAVHERDPVQHRVRAVVETPLVHYRDDVTLWVESDPGGGSVLRARSASRVGKGDFAANTRHLLDLYAQIDTLVPSQTAAAHAH